MYLITPKLKVGGLHTRAGVDGVRNVKAVLASRWHPDGGGRGGPLYRILSVTNISY